MAGDGYLNARQYRPRESRATEVLQNDLIGPVHALRPPNVAGEDGLRALCGAAVIVALPVTWPPPRDQPRCSACRELAASPIPAAM